MTIEATRPVAPASWNAYTSVLTVDQMRVADARAVGRDGDVELMRRAGAGIAAVVRTLAPGNRIFGFAGPGNNGGDLFAAFAELAPAFTCVAIEMSVPHTSAGRKAARLRAVSAGATILSVFDDGTAALLQDADLVLDGMLGSGSQLPLRPPIAEWCRRLQGCRKVLAIDVPTGIDATTGAADPAAVSALATVTIGALKTGLFAESARPRVGKLWLCEIGSFGNSDRETSAVRTLTVDGAAAQVPLRQPEGDKRAAGAPLVIAGSAEFTGAAVLCALGAARTGAGYVTVVTARGAAPTLRTHLIEQVVVSIDETDTVAALGTIAELAAHCGSIAIGPGLDRRESTGEIVRAVIRDIALPMVIDAGAFYHVAQHLELLRGKRLVLTPHATEFALLSGEGPIASGQRLVRLRSFVERHGIVTLLKGLTTLVDDGARVYLNPTGTNALATAGTGDVLTGMIATLLSQGLPPFDAAALGAFWHGRAGRIAQSERDVGVVAGDVIARIGSAVPRTSAGTTAPVRIF
jgi:hydroxyethylthiazole kinase-like uncharacterized protein yjeF